MSWLPCKDWHHRPMQGWSGWWATHRVGSSCSAWGQQAALEDMQCVISLIWIVSTLWMMCMYTNFIATCTSTFIVCDIMQYMRNLTAWSECHLANQSMKWYSRRKRQLLTRKGGAPRWSKRLAVHPHMVAVSTWWLSGLVSSRTNVLGFNEIEQQPHWTYTNSIHVKNSTHAWT